MLSTETISIPIKGHLLQKESVAFAEFQAFEEVQRKPHEYALATRDIGENKINLTRYWYTCADCFSAFPLPESAVSDNSNGDTEVHEKQESSVSFSTWALQTMLLGAEEFFKYGKEFRFRNVPDKDELLACPHCGFTARTAMRSIEYGIHIDDNLQKIVLTQQIEYENRFVALPQRLHRLKPEQFPLTAGLEFSRTHKHSVFWLACKSDDPNGYEILEHFVPDEQQNPLRGYLMDEHIHSASRLKHMLRDAFCRLQGNPIPFAPEEIDLEILMLLNRFQGFPREFYNAIPFSGTGLQVDDSFAEIAECLSRYDEIPSIYQKYGLSDKKAIRRAVFENPALLFYAKELASLPLHNPDIILQVLQSESVFVFLSKLHSLPGISAYISDMIHFKGETAAWSAIQKHLDCIDEAAALYLLCSPQEQRKLLRRKVKDVCRCFYEQNFRSYSIPIPNRAVRIQDTCVNHFDFCVLKNTYEYRKAAAALHNCLAGYQPQDGRVIGVKCNHKYIAAVELCGDEIVQANLSGNRSISENAGLYEAFLQWADMNRLKICTENALK